MWERVLQFVEKKHTVKVATGRVSELFNDTCLTHFGNILERMKKTSLDRLIFNPAKLAKTSEEISNK